MNNPVIELYPGAEDSPFAQMMLTLLRQNIADDPKKLAAFSRMHGRVALIAEDLDAAVTLRFGAGKLCVYRGIHGIPDLAIRGDSDALVDLTRLPPHARLRRLPDLRSDPARALWRALRARTLRIHGLFSHAALAVRFSQVMSVY
jgi:hypothetical protein